MARVNVPLRIVSIDGPLDLLALETQMDAADGAKFINDGRHRLYIRNAGVGAHVVTFETPLTVDSLAVSDKTRTIAAGKEAIIGPFRRELFNQISGADAGYVYATTDGTKTEVKLVLLEK